MSSETTVLVFSEAVTAAQDSTTKRRCRAPPARAHRWRTAQTTARIALPPRRWTVHVQRSNATSSGKYRSSAALPRITAMSSGDSCWIASASRRLSRRVTALPSSGLCCLASDWMARTAARMWWSISATPISDCVDCIDCRAPATVHSLYCSASPVGCQNSSGAMASTLSAPCRMRCRCAPACASTCSAKKRAVATFASMNALSSPRAR